jgi:hypothetical protein
MIPQNPIDPFIKLPGEQENVRGYEPVGVGSYYRFEKKRISGMGRLSVILVVPGEEIQAL